MAGEISLNGIDRSNSNENGVENAASLIVNARKRGSTWEYVGDKLWVGYTFNAERYKAYYWHHKFSNNLIIGYNTGTRKVDVIDTTAAMANVRKRFIDTDGNGDFSLSPDETFMSIHSLNDIIIIDTDKNKYYFVWNEEESNFECLPELPELSIGVTYEEDRLRFVEFTTGSGLSVPTPDIILSGLPNTAYLLFSYMSELIRAFCNKIKESIIDRDVMWKGFRIVAVYELTDGTIIKASNIIPFIDRLFVDSANLDHNMLSIGFIHTALTSRLYLTQAKLLQTNTGGSGMNQIDLYLRLFRNVKVDFSNSASLYDILDKWISHNLISSVSIYISNPSDFVDEKKVMITYWSGLQIGENMTSWNYVPYDNDAAYETNVPYYKIGELAFKSRDTEFEIKPKMLRNVINNKSLNIEQDLSRKYTSNVNMVYNAMIHKSLVRNVIDTDILVYGGKTNSDVCIDLQINNKWIRVNTNSTYVRNSTYPRLHIEIYNSNFQFFSPSVQRANLVIRDYNSTNYHIFKELRIDKSTFTNSLFLFPIIDFDKDPVYNPTDPSNDRYREFRAYFAPMFPENEDFQFNIYNHSVRFGVEFSVLQSLPIPDYRLQNDISYDDTNRLQLSATNNPFVYPAQRSYRFGSENNKVIASESSTVQLSDAKFGQLPLYVFSKQGIWIGETAQGDIAYSTFHLLDNLECYDNPKLIHRVLGGVVFAAVNGIYVVANTTLRLLSQGLEGRVIPQDINGIEQRIQGLNLGQASSPINKLMQDYFSGNSFCVFDKQENELLLIEPSKDFSLVLQLNDMSWTSRKDGHRVSERQGNNITNNGTILQFTDAVIVDNNYRLIGRDIEFGRDLFFSLEESEQSKTSSYNHINNNAVVLISGIIMNNQYVRPEHVISRFSQITDKEYESHLLVIGSRDGIEWKVLNHSKMNAPKSMSGQKMRRVFTSARYFQFAYIRIERNGNNTNRKLSYFERFSFDISGNDAEGKLR